MSNDDENATNVERIEVGDDLYVLALAGSSRGSDRMRRQAAKAMERVREQTDGETD